MEATARIGKATGARWARVLAGIPIFLTVFAIASVSGVAWLRVDSRAVAAAILVATAALAAAAAWIIARRLSTRGAVIVSVLILLADAAAGVAIHWHSVSVERSLESQLTAAQEPADEVRQQAESGVGERPGLQPPSSTSVPQFPWPPPQGSASYVLPDRFIASRHTMGEVTEAILVALEQNGYVERSFFQTPAAGVALVTRLERINDDGSSYPEQQRWPTVRGVPDTDLLSFLRGLFFVESGHYRVIVFIVQSQPFAQSPQPPTEDQVRNWLTSGVNVLPPEIALRPFDGGHVTAIVYEFASDGTSVHLVQSALTGKEHLEKAGVLSLLEKPN
jgi:hypothetical protein